MTTRVSLVGAGPGAPDLLTLRAVQRLGEADLVLSDALASPELRALAPEARWFCVGKRAGRPSMAQAMINRMMIREARRGLVVVRLKGGDPFVLGRGGEEASVLVAAGVPFEVIPGVSSVLAAPALAGIPLTHRGFASGFLVLSGHAESAWRPAVDTLGPGGVTLVVLMGIGARRDIARRLLARGWRKDTPSAVLFGAATPASRRWLGDLASLATADAREIDGGDAPGLIVIGAVVSLASVLMADSAGTAEQD